MSYHNSQSNRRGAVAPFNLLRSAFACSFLALLLSLGVAAAHAQDAPPDPATSTVNINAADAQALAAALNGVGSARARDIVRYREEFGPFTTVEQLAEVKGIGKSTVDKNRAAITLD